MANLLRTAARQLTHPGRKRPNNEDFVDFYEPTDANELLESGCLYIVADGVGGAAHGEQASRYAVQKVLFNYFQPSQLPPPQRLEEAILVANHDIFTYSRSDQVDSQMATTFVAALVLQNQLYVANVGDSPAYLIRNGQIQQLSRDHSLVGERIRDGSLTEEEARQSRIKNQLTRSLGGDEEVMVDITAPIPLLPGDRIVLCTDGVTRYANRQQILQMTGTGSPEEAVKRLIDFSNRQGGADNITALVALVESAEALAVTTSLIPARQLGAVRLEEMETITPGIPQRPGNGSGAALMASKRKKPVSRLENRILQFWILAGGVVLVLLTFGGIYAASSHLNDNPISTATNSEIVYESTNITPSPVASPTITIVPALVISTANNDEKTGTQPSSKMTSTPELSATLYPAPPTDLPLSDPPTQTVAPFIDPNAQCLFQVKDVNLDINSGTLSGIAKKFGISDYNSIKEKYKGGCVPSTEPNRVIGCTAKATVSSTDIFPEEWLVLPVDLKNTTCIIPGGVYFIPGS